MSVYLYEHFRYRGLSMTELDELIYASEMNKGRTVDLTGTVPLTKPGMTTQELAGQIMEIIADTRTAVIPLIVGRAPDVYAHKVMIRFGEGLNTIESLCFKEALKG